MTQLIPLDQLTFRQQLRLLEIAADASDRTVRELARDVLADYRRPPVVFAETTRSPKK